MCDELINRWARHISFSYGRISAYVARTGAGTPEEVLVYNIIEAAAVNIDPDILGAAQPVLEDFCGTGVL
ncbi:hypothetical protein [Anaeroselena agilis]|uniref:Uncharacterized protein n=1 Tax=Anaeroselena agilis TaxID=3063788 RepID=A0ABU3NU88_9FIRM|nr:hypothetical protein [Selenomonadales bacterium 4137-cl]